MTAPPVLVVVAAIPSPPFSMALSAFPRHKRRLAVAGIVLIALLSLLVLLRPFDSPLSSRLSLISDLALPPPPLLPTSDPDGTPTDEADELTMQTKADVVEEDPVAADSVKCDLYEGEWVMDEEGQYPLYPPGTCPYVDDAFTCTENGRPDSDYTRWRWKPHGCDLPRFNATDFLEKLRGKKLILVGDSMNRNQFESLLCMLREALTDKSRMYETSGYKISKGRGYFVYKFVDYDCTVEFVRSHFLVREGKRVNRLGNSNPTLMIDRIDKSTGRWKRGNIVVFNTGHWWTHGKTARGNNYYQEGDFIHPKFDAIEAFKRAMRTWGSWIDENMNSPKKLIIYRGYSSPHFRGGEWDSGGTCNGETDPITNGTFLDSYPLKMKIVEEVIRDMHVPVVLLNVTRLTNYRKDGHPSYYRKKPPKGEKVSKRRQDCSHWCLPGVPDSWNELIYAILVMRSSLRH